VFAPGAAGGGEALCLPLGFDFSLSHFKAMEAFALLWVDSREVRSLLTIRAVGFKFPLG